MKKQTVHPDCYRTKSAKTSLYDAMGIQYISAHGMGGLHICGGTSMQRLMLAFWRDICGRQGDNFSQELHVYFSRTIPGLILHKL